MRALAIAIGLLVCSGAQAQEEAPPPEAPPADDAEPQPEEAPPDDAEAPEGRPPDSMRLVEPFEAESPEEEMTTAEAQPVKPPRDLELMGGVNVIYAPGEDGGPLLMSVELGVVSRTLQLGYAELRSVIPWLPVSAELGQEYGKTHACYLCFSVGFRAAKRSELAHFTVGLDYHWVYLGAGGLDDIRAPCVGGSVGYMARVNQWELLGRFGLQAIMTGGMAGHRELLDLRAYRRLAGPLAFFGHIGLIFGNVSDADPDYAFFAPTAQVGLALAY